MKVIAALVAAALLLTSCGGPITATVEIPDNAILFRVYPGNMPLRHSSTPCPTEYAPYIGNYDTVLPDGGRAVWKAFAGLEAGYHCFFVVGSGAADIGIEPLAFEVYLNEKEFTAPEEVMLIGIPLVP